jgi:hypothetical protein
MLKIENKYNSSSHLTDLLLLLLVHVAPPYFVYPWSLMCSRGLVGWEVCFVAVGHVEGCRRVRTRKMMCERWVNQKYLENKLANHFLPPYFVCPSSMMYSREFGGRMGWEVDVGWLASGGRWGGEKSKFSWAHQNISSKSLMQSTSHLLFLPSTSRRCVREATGVGSGVEVGRGEGGGRCHDGGKGQHEVSPCLCF